MVAKLRLDGRKDLTVGRLGVQDGPGERGDIAAVRADVGTQQATRSRLAQGALLVALRTGDGVEGGHVGLDLGVRRIRVRLGLGPCRIRVRDIAGLGRGRIILGRVQDVADLHGVGAQGDGGRGHVDLRDLALRTGLDRIRDDLVLQLLADDIAAHDLAVLRKVDVVVDQLVLVGLLHRFRGDLRDPPDAEDAVLTLHDGGRRVQGRGKHRAQEGLIRLTVVRVQPAQVAALGRRGGVRGDRLGDLVPGLAALDVAQRLLRDRLGGRDLGGRWFHRASTDGRGDLDDPGVSRLTGGRLLDESRIKVRVRDGDTFLGRDVGLDPVIDQALQGDPHDLLALLLDDLALDVRLGLGEAPRHGLRLDAPLGLVQAPGLDEGSVPQLRLGDGLTVDTAHGGKVVVVVRQPDGHQKDEDRQGDHQAEAQVRVEIPPVATLPRRFRGALDDGLGSKCHRLDESCGMVVMAGLSPGGGRRVWTWAAGIVPQPRPTSGR